VLSMGAIETAIKKDADLTIHKATGKISSTELIAAINKYYSGVTTRLILWDFTEADLGSIKSSELEEIIVLTKKYANLRPNGKTAMAASSDLGFGMGRMFELQEEFVKPNIVLHRSFRDREKALLWLQGD
jgi:hypothetical protein